jgi:pyrrolidone-carboxylate peptidase
LDNKKRKHKSGTIKSSGNDFYLTNVDVSKIKDHLKKKNIPAKIHNGAKGMNFLCNFAGYLSAYHCCKSNSKARHLFIHVPAPEAIPYDVSLRGIKEIIDFLIYKKNETGFNLTASQHSMLRK